MGRHDSGATSNSPRSGHGGRHSADPTADRIRTDPGKLFGPTTPPRERGK